MKNKLFIPVLLISFLALALVLSGCSNGSTDDDRPAWVQALDDGYSRGEFNSFAGSGNGDHVLLWGSFDASFTEVNDTITQQGWAVTPTDSSQGGWATGADAIDILLYCVGGIDYLDGGIAFNSYPNLLNTNKDGVALLPGLKTAISSKEGDVPVAGIFFTQDFFVVFFIDSK
jgi:hypothetical protein